VTSGPAAAGSAPPRKLYVGDGKVRIETSDAEGGAIVIADTVERSLMTLLPEQKLFNRMRRPGPRVNLVLPVDPGDPCPGWQQMSEGLGVAPGAAWRCAKVADETVAGRSTILYRADLPDGTNRRAWLDPSLRFFIRVEDGQGRETTLENIEEGKQPRPISRSRPSSRTSTGAR